VLFNEELLFIISFLLVFYFLFNGLTALFASSLDRQALDIATQMRNFSIRKINSYKEVKLALEKSTNLLDAFGGALSYYVYALEKGTERVNILRKFFWFEHYRDFIRAVVVIEINLAKQFLNLFVSRLKMRLLKHRLYKRYYKKNTKRAYTISRGFSFLKACNFKTKLLLKLR
jgi:hypothetical protein